MTRCQGNPSGWAGRGSSILGGAISDASFLSWKVFCSFLQRRWLKPSQDAHTCCWWRSGEVFAHKTRSCNPPPPPRQHEYADSFNGGLYLDCWWVCLFRLGSVCVCVHVSTAWWHSCVQQGVSVARQPHPKTLKMWSVCAAAGSQLEDCRASIWSLRAV